MGAKTLKKDNRSLRLLTNVSEHLKTWALISVFCFLCFMFTIAGRFFMTPDEYLGDVLRKVVSPVTQFITKTYEGTPQLESVSQEIEGISQKGFSFTIGDQGEITPYSPHHLTLSYDEDTVPAGIKGNFKEFLARALQKIKLIPKGLDVALGRFMVLAFAKEFQAIDPLTSEEEAALKSTDQFSENKPGDFPHISLVEWISGKDKKKGLKGIVTSSSAEIQELISGTEFNIKRLANSILPALVDKISKEEEATKAAETAKGAAANSEQKVIETETKRSTKKDKKRAQQEAASFKKDKRIIEEAYTIIADARVCFLLPVFEFSDGSKLDLNSIEGKEWNQFFGIDGQSESSQSINVSRLNEFIAQLQKIPLVKKPLLVDMNPLIAQIDQVTTQIEKNLKIPARGGQLLPSMPETAGDNLYDESEFDKFGAELANKFGFKLWYGTRFDKDASGASLGKVEAAAAESDPLAQRRSQLEQQKAKVKEDYEKLNEILITLTTGTNPTLEESEQQTAQILLTSLKRAIQEFEKLQKAAQSREAELESTAKAIKNAERLIGQLNSLLNIQK